MALPEFVKPENAEVYLLNRVTFYSIFVWIFYVVAQFFDLVLCKHRVLCFFLCICFIADEEEHGHNFLPWRQRYSLDLAGLDAVIA
jgi:hypothetical protein